MIYRGFHEIIGQSLFILGILHWSDEGGAKEGSPDLLVLAEGDITPKH